jgi:predicted ATP-grasp superfamily ATP-dependent carboligase
MIVAAHGASATASIVGLSVGVAALLVGLGWRQQRMLQTGERLERRLRDPDPAARASAVREAAALGLERTAGVILRVARSEHDPEVLEAIEAAVGSRLWEPVTTGDALELRRWVAARRDPERPAPGRTSPPLPRVMVTGAGGAAGVAVIRDLRRAGHHVVGVDADEMAVGFELADEFRVVPRWDDRAFARSVTDAAATTDVDALICTVAEEIGTLDADALAGAGVRTMLPDAEAARTCVDKWAFAAAMTDAGLPAPRTELGSSGDIPKPWIVKPRFGRGSRDVTVAHTVAELRVALRRTPDPIVQALVSGREFTADALVDRSGSVAGVVPRWRLETKAGISTRGMTFHDPEVVNIVTIALKAVGIVGPAGAQGFVTDAGDVVIIEINPRFTGGLPLSLHAGADLVGEYLRAILGQPMRPERLVGRAGVMMRRYYEEAFSA